MGIIVRIAWLFFAVFAFSPIATQAGEDGERRDVLHVSVDKNYPPYSFLDASDHLVGYTVDLWQIWAKNTGVKVELVGVNLDSAIASALEGKVEVIDTIFENSPRKQHLLFSKPYATIPVNVYTHASLTGISSTASLKGFVVGVKNDDACVDQLETAGVSQLVRFEDYETLVRSAKNGQIKSFCMDEPSANYFLYKEGAASTFRQAFKIFTGTLHRAVVHDDEATLQLVERGFSAVSSEEYADLTQKWMGASLSSPFYDRRLAFAFLGAVFVVVVLLVRGFRLSRRQRDALDNERTHLRALVHALPDFAWLKDRQGVLLACNPALEALYGFHEKDLVGKLDSEFLDRTLAESFRRSDALAIEAGKPCNSEEWFLAPESKEPRLLEIIKTPMYSKQGIFLGVLGIARDITVRRRNEDALRVSEQKFAAAFRSSPDAIIISQSSDGCIVDVNDAFVRLSGYCRDEMIGLNGLQLELWGNSQDRDYSFQELRTKGVLRECEGGFRVRSGELRVGLISAEVIEIDSRPHFLWVVRDITKQKQMENDLRDSEQKFSTAFHMSPHAHVLSRMSDDCVVEVSDALLQLSGLSRHEMVGKSGRELGFWADRALRSRCLERLKVEGRISGVESRLLDKTALVSAETVLIGEEPHILWVVHDITERKVAEDALRSSEQKFAAAFRASPDAIMITDVENKRIIDVNEAMVQMIGYDRDEMIGSTAESLEVWPEGPALEQYVTALRDHGRVREIEATFFTKKKSMLFGLLSAELIVINERLHTLAIFHDITLRRITENELKAANKRLTSLSVSLLQIQENERRILAHELHDEVGQSLTAQKISLQTLRKGMASSAERDKLGIVVEITNTILNQIRRMSLDLRPPQLDDLGLPAAIRWNLTRQSSLAAFVPHFSSECVPGKLPESITIACYRISQEAITNAIKHGQAHNVWVSIDCQEGTLHLQIRDDGAGFDPSLLEEGKSMGILGMRERATFANGHLSVTAELGVGCIVAAQFAL